jgi:hypothetical protein
MTVSKVEDPPVVKLKEPKKKVEELPGIELTDPTSLTLINSFLIKNAGPTFDNYHKTMQQKKRMGMGSQNSPTVAGGHQASFTMGGSMS